MVSDFSWYVIQTKPRQEEIALDNLQNQDYICYLPKVYVEKPRRGSLVKCSEALFPRYLFIRLSEDWEGKSWSPIRSTKGVHKLVQFGNQAAKIDENIILALQAHEAVRQGTSFFQHGEKVRIMEGAFAGLDAIFEMADGEQRAIILINLLNQTSRLAIAINSIRKL